MIAPVARSVVAERSGWLLWGGGLVGLWTVGSLVETIRDILRRAYGTRPTKAFWHYRLLSTGIILAAVILLMLSLIAQFLIGAAQEVIAAWVPQLYDAIDDLALSRAGPRARALRLALPDLLHADPGGLPQAALSQVAGRAGGDRVVGRRPPPRCRRCCAACSPTTSLTARSPGS